MKIYFSRSITVTCLILALLMVRASFWQWDRHQQKLVLIDQMQENLEHPEASLAEVLRLAPKEQHFRRVQVSGTFDHKHEMYLGNRRLDGYPGFHLITPLRIELNNRNTTGDVVVLVNRGFVPTEFLNDRESLLILRPEGVVTLSAIVKESMPRNFLHPPLPRLGRDLPFRREWLLVEPLNMQKQLPYELKDFFLEVIPEAEIDANLLIETKSGKDELLLLSGRGTPLPKDFSEAEFPIPVLNTFVPPGRHLGYVYEWAIMAIFTLLIGLVLQLRPPRYMRSEQ